MSGDKDIDDELASQDEMLDDEYGDAGGEDEEFADEDWDSYDEEGGEGDGGEEEGAPRKKGMPKFNKILIAGALGVGLCVVAFTMLTSKPAPTPPGGAQQRPAQAQQAGNAGDIQRQRLNSASLSDSAPTTQRDVIYGRNREENVIAPVNDNVTDEGGLLNDPTEVQKIEKYRAQLEEELQTEEQPVDGEDAAQGAVVTADPGQDLPAATPQVVNQEPPMPVTGADSVLTPLPDATATPAEDSASVGLPRAQDLALSDGTETPTSAEVPVDAAPVAVDAAPVVAETPAPAADVTALTTKIETLQSDLDTQTAKVKELESTVQQLERALESRAADAPRAATPAKRKASSSTTAVKKSASPVRWVLKSAQPGHAMVSRAGENEMRNVTVGDTLPGVGRVTQIYQSPTGWIVQGTDGRILQ